MAYVVPVKKSTYPNYDVASSDSFSELNQIREGHSKSRGRTLTHWCSLKGESAQLNKGTGAVEKGNWCSFKGSRCSFNGELVQLTKQRVWLSFNGWLVRFKKGIGAV